MEVDSRVFDTIALYILYFSLKQGIRPDLNSVISDVQFFFSKETCSFQHKTDSDINPDVYLFKQSTIKNP